MTSKACCPAPPLTFVPCTTQLPPKWFNQSPWKGTKSLGNPPAAGAPPLGNSPDLGNSPVAATPPEAVAGVVEAAAEANQASMAWASAKHGCCEADDGAGTHELGEGIAAALLRRCSEAATAAGQEDEELGSVRPAHALQAVAAHELDEFIHSLAAVAEEGCGSMASVGFACEYSACKCLQPWPRGTSSNADWLPPPGSPPTAAAFDDKHPDAARDME